MVNYRKKALKFIDTAKEVSKGLLGKELSRAVNQRAVDVVSMPAYKNGSKVLTKTGPAMLHKGEKVLSAKQVKELKKLFK